MENLFWDVLHAQVEIESIHLQQSPFSSATTAWWKGWCDGNVEWSAEEERGNRMEDLERKGWKQTKVGSFTHRKT